MRVLAFKRRDFTSPSNNLRNSVYREKMRIGRSAEQDAEPVETVHARCAGRARLILLKEALVEKKEAQ